MTSSIVKADLQNSGRVLVYDDDEILLDLLGTVLIRDGYHIETTLCAQEGTRLISTQRFDVAVVDLGFRRTSGYGLLRKIKEVSPETVILAVSAYPSDEVVRFARTHAHAFLDKPFSLAEFVCQVGCLLELGRETTDTELAHSPDGLGVEVAEAGISSIPEALPPVGRYVWGNGQAGWERR
jgi:DNA-binding NtrC family response regulator